MKSFTKEEFIEYVKTLKFDELEDMADFVAEYFEYYEKLPNDPVQDKNDAWEKYVILMARFGMTFVTFTKSVIEYRKKLNEEIRAEEENRSSGSLEVGTD